jgi:DNA repair exonuclease SbcCD nuclease subunit
MRILHAADIHLDSPLTALRQRAGQRADDLVDATRRAFKKLVQYAIDQKIELLLISGDNWDGKHKDFNSLLFFAAEMKRLRDAGCRVFLIRGNHDAENNMTLTMPEGVHVLSAEHPETIRIEELGVAIHGQSFIRRDVRENLAAAYPEAVAGLINIGMLHTAVQNYTGAHTSYAPCTVDDLQSKGYDYWALGHIHKRTEIATDPWIVYPGNLQARHINETGAKGATLITTGSGRIKKVEHVALDVLRWARTEIDVAGFETIEDLCNAFEPALQQALDQAEGRALATRVALTGKTALHRRLKLEAVRIEAEALRAAEAAGEVWLDDLEIETEDSQAENGERDDAADAVIAEAALLKDGKEQRDRIRRAIVDLPEKLNPTLRKDAGLEEIDDAMLDAVIADARDMLLARLQG